MPGTKPPIEVRDLAGPDMKALALVYSRASTSQPNNEKWTQESAMGYLSSFVTHTNILAKVACLGGKVVGGVITIVSPWADGTNLNIEEIFIDPDSQGIGVGSLLFRSVMVDAMKKHPTINAVWLVASRKDRPIEWYRKIGFADMEDLSLLKADPKILAARLASKA